MLSLPLCTIRPRRRDRVREVLFLLMTCLPAVMAFCDEPQSARSSPSRPPELRVTFTVMGDVPYEPKEDRMQIQQIAELPNNSEFSVHVGDIKSGKTACDEVVYDKVSGMLSKAKAPLFIIPGDNEWNDCADPDEAWQLWQNYFRRFDEQWSHRFGVFRQLEREENFPVGFRLIREESPLQC